VPLQLITGVFQRRTHFLEHLRTLRPHDEEVSLGTRISVSIQSSVLTLR
jgi:hypothetical protein